MAIIFKNDHDEVNSLGIFVTNYLPDGWRKATREDLLDLKYNRIRENVEFIIESFMNPGIFERYNTTKHRGVVMDLKPWMEAEKVWVKNTTV